MILTRVPARWQVSPPNPSTQTQTNCPGRSTHVPPLTHGDDTHSSKSTSQNLPIHRQTSMELIFKMTHNYTELKRNSLDYEMCSGVIRLMTGCYTDGSDSSHRCHLADHSIVFARWHQYAASSDTWYIEPTRVSSPNGISIGPSYSKQYSCICNINQLKHGLLKERRRSGICSALIRPTVFTCMCMNVQMQRRNYSE